MNIMMVPIVMMMMVIAMMTISTTTGEIAQQKIQIRTRMTPSVEESHTVHSRRDLSLSEQQHPQQEQLQQKDGHILIPRRRRDLHALPYKHTHFQPPERPPQSITSITYYNDGSTEAPTVWWYDDDAYDTDDGAIDETMINRKKQLYEQEEEQEHKHPSSSSSINSIVQQENESSLQSGSSSTRSKSLVMMVVGGRRIPLITGCITIIFSTFC